MEFADLIEWVGNEPVFETGLLLAGATNSMEVRKQLSRWVAAGKVYQLRRGLYSLAPPYQKIIPHPFLVANRISQASYVSLQSALAYYGLIPESVPITTSVVTGRPIILTTPVGVFDFRHIQPGWFHSYVRIDLSGNQAAFIARPEKALLDLIYLVPGSDTLEYLHGLRLQNLDRLDLDVMRLIMDQAKRPKLIRSYNLLKQIRIEEKTGYESL